MNRLSEIRRLKGLSQSELADLLGTTSVSVGRYEKEDQRLTLPLMRTISKILGVSVSDIAGESRSEEGSLPVPVFDVRVSAGPGSIADESDPLHHLMFREEWLRAISRDPAYLLVLQVSGDSMWETLHDGDHALVDRAQINPRQEGLYVLRIDDMLQVKRLSMHPVSRMLTIKSDNPAYPTYSDINPMELTIFGRVIWIGRSLG